METGIIFIGVFLTLLVVSPFFIFKDKGKKQREKSLLTELNQKANDNGAAISNFEIWNNSIIGVDSQKQLAFFITNAGKQKASGVVNLADIKRCRLVTRHHSGEYHHSTVKVVDKISIALEYKGKDKPDVLVEVYNDEFDNLTLSGELQLAQKWVQNLNKLAGAREVIIAS